jgi:hypothetical protein
LGNEETELSHTYHVQLYAADILKSLRFGSLRAVVFVVKTSLDAQWRVVWAEARLE